MGFSTRWGISWEKHSANVWKTFLRDFLIFQTLGVFLKHFVSVCAAWPKGRARRKGSWFILTACLRAFRRARSDEEKAAAPCGSCALPSVKDEKEPSEDIKSTVSLTIFKLKWSFLMKSRSCACNRRRKANEARRNARARQTDIIILFLPFSYN